MMKSKNIKKCKNLLTKLMRLTVMLIIATATVWCFASHNDTLIVGGAFTSAGGKNAKYIARFSKPLCCVGVRGNWDGDPNEEIDISDVVYMVEYMFNEGDPGPAPVCFEEGDIFPLPSPDKSIDIADLVMMVEYQFSADEQSQGPPPGNCP